VLPFTVGLRDGAVQLVSTFGSVVISARAALGSIIRRRGVPGAEPHLDEPPPPVEVHVVLALLGQQLLRLAARQHVPTLYPTVLLTRYFALVTDQRRI
jgi:hypothetical protein